MEGFSLGTAKCNCMSTNKNQNTGAEKEPLNFFVLSGQQFSIHF